MEASAAWGHLSGFGAFACREYIDEETELHLMYVYESALGGAPKGIGSGGGDQAMLAAAIQECLPAQVSGVEAGVAVCN